MSFDAPFIPSCSTCGEMMFTRPKGCSNSDCSHSMTFKLEALRVAAQALANQMTDHPHEPASWFDHELAALEAALKAVGS